jgi:hypothetical protein
LKNLFVKDKIQIYYNSKYYEYKIKSEGIVTKNTKVKFEKEKKISKTLFKSKYFNLIENIGIIGEKRVIHSLLVTGPSGLGKSFGNLILKKSHQRVL